MLTRWSSGDWVTVGGRIEHVHPLAGLDPDAGEFHVGRRGARHVCHGAVPPQHLLDGQRDAGGVLDQQLALVGVRDQGQRAQGNLKKHDFTCI